MKYRLIAVALGALVVSALPLHAQPVTAEVIRVSDRQATPVPALELRDQFDRPLLIDAQSRYLIVAKSKASSDWMGQWLAAQAPSFLNDQHAYYLADIHKMPKLITRMVALPKMKKLEYPIYLGRTAEALAMFSVQEGCVTLVKLDALTIASQTSVCAGDALMKAMVGN